MHRFLLSAAHTRLLCALGLGVLVGGVVALGAGPSWGVLAAVALTCGGFVLSGWAALWPLDAEQTRARADREDFRPRLEETVIAGAGVAAVAAVVTVTVLSNGGSSTSATGPLAGAVGLAGVFLAWAMLHLMYATRYAHEYYRGTPGGIDFNTEQPPRYVDFLYFSYNLGMTFQVSDTNVTSTPLRAVILRHCLLSYVFSTVVLAATVSLVAGILT